ncbi:unnamed protein product, partial [Ectocarpus sp. 13 AM-2016]
RRHDSTIRPSTQRKRDTGMGEDRRSALYSILFLTTSGAARCLLRKYETKKGQKADGREAWLALNRKYENTSSHRWQALMARLA